jgi:hypothetical protein
MSSKANSKTQFFGCECGGEISVTLSQGKEGIDVEIKKCTKCKKQKTPKEL